MAHSPIIYGTTGATSVVPGGITLPGSTSGSLQIQPSAVTTSYALTMPATQSGAGQSLVNDGVGALTWTTIGPLNPTIGVGYGNTAGTALASGVATVIPWPTLEFDTSSIMNASTGVATVPAGALGKYAISVVCRVLTTGTTPVYGKLFKNGVDYKTFAVGFSGGGGECTCGGSVIVNLIAGDAITFVVICFNTGSLQTGVGGNYFSMMRIGI